MPVLCEVEGYPTGPGNSAPASRRRTLGRPDQANPTMFGSQCAHTRGWTRRFASATVLGSPSLERVHFSMHWLALFESCASCTGRSKRCPRSAATKLIKNPFRGVKGFSTVFFFDPVEAVISMQRTCIMVVSCTSEYPTTRS